MNEFVHQARLAHARLANDRHYLTATSARELQRKTELLLLDAAADKTCQAPSGGGVEASSRRARSGHLVNLYWIGESLHRHGAEGLRDDIAFRQMEGVGRNKHRTWHCHLFHAIRQVHGLAHDRVVHAQIVADRTDDNFA